MKPVSSGAHAGPITSAEAVKRFPELCSFIEGAVEHRKAVLEDPAKRDTYQKLPEGQAPDVMVVSCSDSRYSPIEVFNMAPGRIFEKQHVGAIVGRHDLPPMLRDRGTLATLTYAITKLRVKHIIILGHTSCGAVAGIMGGDKHLGLASRLGGKPLRRMMAQGVEQTEGQASQPFARALQAAVDNVVRPLVETGDYLAREVSTRLNGEENVVLDFLQLAGDVPSRVRAHYGQLDGDQLQMAASQETAILQREHLLRYPVVRKALADGSLLGVHACVFELGSRVVNIFDEKEGVYLPLNAPESGLPRRRALVKAKL